MKQREEAARKGNFRRFLAWFHGTSAKCAAVIIAGTAGLFCLFALACVSARYSLQAGDIAHQTIVATKDVEDTVTTEQHRKAAAAARAEKKKAESDALTDAIYELITDKLVTVDEITVAFDDEEVTRAKVTARLGKLVNAGLIEKESVRVDGKKRMAYRRISTAVEE